MKDIKHHRQLSKPYDRTASNGNLMTSTFKETDTGIGVGGGREFFAKRVRKESTIGHPRNRSGVTHRLIENATGADSPFRHFTVCKILQVSSADSTQNW